MKKNIAILFSIFIIIILFIFFRTPIIGKYIFGTARIIDTRVHYKVLVNNRNYDKCKIFEIKESYDGKHNCNLLVLYFENNSNPETRNVILIDLSDKKVGQPNSNKKDYDVIFGNLFQSESGSFYVPFDDIAKGYGFNTDLIIINKKIKFKLPNWSEDKINSVQLIKE
ncbi:MAG: hypothetical protein C0412_10380 [Flavobacterium sp.]|nr:hypothetical protein [Flavobacterium sp.]